MNRTIIGIPVTALIVYIWGFLFWGVNPIPYESLRQTENDAATQEILRQYFPDSGTYLVPGTDHSPEELEALFAAGPRAIVHLRAGGGPVMDPMVLAGGALLNLVFVSLLAAFFRVAKASEFRDFARLSLISGVVAVVLIDAGDIIWWQESISWNAWQAVYNFSAFLIAGHLLGIFMKDEVTL